MTFSVTPRTRCRRLVLTGATTAVAAACLFGLGGPAGDTPMAACTPGEEEDVFTTVCTPFMVPNSPEGFQPIPGNPDLPEIDGIPCSGRNSGECIGLAEEQQAMGPQPVPRSIISASP